MKILVFAVCTLMVGAQSAEKLLEGARHKEVMGGDLKGAIAEYRKIAERFAKQPEIAAQALVKMGACQEKLGEAESRRSYERVVKEYAGAGAFVVQARARLAAMGETGRYLSHVDWTTGDLAIRDLRTGESKRVTNYGGHKKAEGEVEGTSISPDGKRIVFGWGGWDKASKAEGIYLQLRVINADGSGERLLRKIPGKGWAESYGWSPDGKLVGVCLSGEANGDAQIALLSPDSGALRVIPTDSKFWKSYISFSPDGKWLAYEERLVERGRSRNIFVVAADGTSPAPAKLVDNANLMGWSPSGDAIIFRKEDVAGDHLYTLPVVKGEARAEAAILHTPSIGNAQSLGLTATGDLFYGVQIQRLDAWITRLDTVAGLAPDPLAKFAVAGIEFANNAGYLRFSADGKQLAAAVSVNSIKIRNMADAAERVLTLQVKELRRFEWMPDGASFVASAVGLDGKIGLYRVGASNGEVAFVCLDTGMSFALSADGKSAFRFASRALSVIDLATGNERVLLSRDFSEQGTPNIRPSRDGKSLMLTTMGYIGIYDIASNELREIYKRSGEIGEAVWVAVRVAVRVADWSADGRQIVALVHGINNGPNELRFYPVSGGAPRVHTIPEKFRNLSISPDGIHAAIVKSDDYMQVWALENFLPGKK